MDYHRLANTEAELWHPPPARWLRYQGKQELRHPDAVRHAVDRAAASAWEHIPPVFRPFIADRLACLGLKAGRRTQWRSWGRGSSSRVADDSVLPEGYPRLRSTVGYMMAYALLVELAAIAAGADRCTGAVPFRWQGVAAARWYLRLQERPGHPRERAGGHQRHGEGDPRRLGIADPDQIRHRRRHLSRASRLWATTP